MRVIKNKWFKFNNKVSGSADVAELFIYGEITSYKWVDSDVTAEEFKEDLDSLGDISTLNIYINSPGGSVFQGQAILSMINRFKEKNQVTVNVIVDGIAASIASVIAMSGDTITIPQNAMMMIHNAWTIALGNADELRKVADDLDKINQSIINAYLDKAKVSEEKIKELMDEETWLTADEADEIFDLDISEEKNIAASIKDFKDSLEKYNNTPKFIIEKDEDKENNFNDEKKVVEEKILKLEVLSRINQ